MPDFARLALSPSTPRLSAPLRASGVDCDSGAKQAACRAKNAQERVAIMVLQA